MTGPTPPSRQEIDAAIRDLAELRSRDPAARPAVHAIALTRLTLESFRLDRAEECTGDRRP